MRDRTTAPDGRQTARRKRPVSKAKHMRKRYREIVISIDRLVAAVCCATMLAAPGWQAARCASEQALEAPPIFSYFPFPECVLCTIKKLDSAPSLMYTNPTSRTFVIVDEVLRGRFHKGDKLSFYIRHSDDRALPKNAKPGDRCVFAFFYNPDLASQWPAAPFAQQHFSEGELEALKSRLHRGKEKHSNQKEALQQYLEKRWTPERIKNFCRPEDRQVRLRHNLIPRGDVIEGALYPNKLGDLKVNWIAEMQDGMPKIYALNANRGKDRWTLEINGIQFAGLSDDEVLRDRLISTLEAISDACPRQFVDGHPSEFYALVIRRSLAPGRLQDAHIVKNSSGAAVAMEATMPDKRKLSVQLKPDTSIDTVMLDGKPDSAWNRLYTDFEKNYKVVKKRKIEQNGVYDGMKP